jgi:hypothetical protein
MLLDRAIVCSQQRGTHIEPIKRAHSPQLAAGLASVYKLVVFLTVKIPRSLLRGASMHNTGVTLTWT